MSDCPVVAKKLSMSMAKPDLYKCSIMYIKPNSEHLIRRLVCHIKLDLAHSITGSQKHGSFGNKVARQISIWLDNQL